MTIATTRCPISGCTQPLWPARYDGEPWCIVHGEQYGRRPAHGVLEQDLADRNQYSTHCSRGHEWTEANTGYGPLGKRRCLSCEPHRNRPGAALRTHCRNGHEYTEDNTIYISGYRRCAKCRRVRGAGGAGWGKS